jgi:hypothetical protein
MHSSPFFIKVKGEIRFIGQRIDFYSFNLIPPKTLIGITQQGYEPYYLATVAKFRS